MQQGPFFVVPWESMVKAHSPYSMYCSCVCAFLRQPVVGNKLRQSLWWWQQCKNKTLHICDYKSNTFCGLPTTLFGVDTVLILLSTYLIQCSKLNKKVKFRQCGTSVKWFVVFVFKKTWVKKTKQIVHSNRHGRKRLQGIQCYMV